LLVVLRGGDFSDAKHQTSMEHTMKISARLKAGQWMLRQ
jgi:hypothetical protein